MSRQPPPTGSNLLNYAQPAPANEIRLVAMRQKAIMYCMLGYIVLFALQFAAPPFLRIVLAVVTFAVWITAAVFVFRLSLTLYSKVTGVILGILTLIPLLGVIVLLMINGEATKVLREQGIKVGLMGARGDQIPAAGVWPDQTLGRGPHK